MHYYNALQIREIFHIAFLRAFTQRVKPLFYSLKGGVNMRLFFGSIRYSEDIDLDINIISLNSLRNAVMAILNSQSLRNELKPFGIENILPPNINRAKQTQTTQRFKVHLITHQAEDLFTKIEFSRRKSFGTSAIEPISEKILRQYRMPPVIISHYDAQSAICQKVDALANRQAIQARDIFDLYILSTQLEPNTRMAPEQSIRKKAVDNIFLVDFKQFRDTVLDYLPEEEKTIYSNLNLWDEIKVKVSDFITNN